MLADRFRRTTLAARGAAWLLALPLLAQAAPPSHIAIGAQQLARAGIQTSAALAPADAANGAPAPEQGLRLSGTALAPAGASRIVSSTLGGVVQQVHLDALAPVRAGAALATLFSQPFLELQREYLQLATQDRLAQDKLARDAALYDEGIVALGRLQDSQAAADGAAVAASERRHALRAAGLGERAIDALLASRRLSPYLTLRAPDGGTVLEIEAQPGQRVEAGMALARIGREAPLWLEFQASRQQAALIRVGDRLELKECGAVRVRALAPRMDGANQSVLVRARQERADACLKPNQFVEARHVGARAGGASVGVPAAAVVQHAGARYVFVRAPAGFEAVEVAVLAGPPPLVWVEGRLRAGQQVASAGLVGLKGAWLGFGPDAGAAPGGRP